MGLKICSFASGSRGNCIFVSSDTTSVLVDAGICCKRIRAGLSAMGATGEFNLLITHAHSDHIGHIGDVVKAFSPIVYTHYLTYDDITKKIPDYLKLKEFDGDFYVGDITVSPFRVSHDVPCVGFCFLNAGRKISIVTDVGRLTDDNMRRLDGSDVVLIESNHDEDMLRANPRYSPSLKRRILSDRGHLNNRACAEAAAKCIKGGAKQIILGHLSLENNTPELAYGATCDYLEREGLNARVSIAYQDKLSEVVEVN